MNIYFGTIGYIIISFPDNVTVLDSPIDSSNGCFFSVRLLSVLRGHLTSKDFYTRSYPLHYFLILFLEKWLSSGHLSNHISVLYSQLYNNLMRNGYGMSEAMTTYTNLLKEY